MSTPNKHVETLTRKLLVKTLFDTFMFNHDAQEIEIWLDSLPKQATSAGAISADEENKLSEQQSIILSYLDDCISRFMKAQYKYMDAGLEIVQQTNSAAMDVDETDGDSQKKASQSVVQQNALTDSQPFSPLLITVMEQFGYVKEGKDVVARFIYKIFSRLTGKQLTTGYLLSAFDHYLSKHLEGNLQTKDLRSATKWTSQMILASTSNLLKTLSTVPNHSAISAIKPCPLPPLDTSGKPLSRHILLYRYPFCLTWF